MSDDEATPKRTPFAAKRKDTEEAGAEPGGEETRAVDAAKARDGDDGEASARRAAEDDAEETRSRSGVVAGAEEERRSLVRRHRVTRVGGL